MWNAWNMFRCSRILMYFNYLLKITISVEKKTDYVKNTGMCLICRSLYKSSISQYS